MKKTFIYIDLIFCFLLRAAKTDWSPTIDNHRVIYVSIFIPDQELQSRPMCALRRPGNFDRLIMLQERLLGPRGQALPYPVSLVEEGQGRVHCAGGWM